MPSAENGLLTASSVLLFRAQLKCHLLLEASPWPPAVSYPIALFLSLGPLARTPEYECVCLFAVHVFASQTISAAKTGARLACLLHDPTFRPGTEKAQQSC